MHEFTFESLQKRVLLATAKSGLSVTKDDPEALFMWSAFEIVATTHEYMHLTPEEVFEHLKSDTRLQQLETKQMMKEVFQLIKELEAKDEELSYPHDCITNRQSHGSG